MNLKNKFVFASKTDTGRVRDHNEDAIASNEDMAMFVLADGMGGYNAGEVASGIAVKTVYELTTEACAREKPYERHTDTGLMRQTIVLRDAISRANKIIHQTAQSHDGCQGMGTTIVAGIFCDNRLSIAHVGDSRLYRLRNSKLERITRDHSLLQELVDRGFYSHEEAKQSTNKNYITRALGAEITVDVEIQEVQVEMGDIYLVCSDGLSDMVDDEEIHLTLSTFSASLSSVAEQLVKISNQHGGKDNISVMLVKALAPFPANTGLFNLIKKLIKC
jgi:serine/threonine protein phosphatase PrpC